MGLITIADLEIANNTIISSDDEPFYQWYIDFVSRAIETATGTKFSSVTGAVLKSPADSAGIIEFSSPLTAVTLVELYDPGDGSYLPLTRGSDYFYDGLNSIFGLWAYETYRITVDYGWTACPAEIKDVVTALVAAGSGLDVNASSGLSTYRVGDVEEVFGVSRDGSGNAAITMTTLQAAIVESYSTGRAETWRL